MTLIELEKLEMDFRLCNDTDSHWTPQRVLQMIVRQPHVDAKPVVHGEWMFKDDDLDSWYECSACGYCNFHYARNHFCPNCGADMRPEK